jgi:transcriptional regulator with XRE-family HTH domain
MNRRLTQEQVATALGVSVPTYRKIETDPSRISVEKALRLADVFGVKFEDLALYDATPR